MMKKTSFAISTDESRYVLNGIFISLKEHKMTMVATDGRRLALVDEEVDVAETSQGEFIVPAKAVNELSRLLAGQRRSEISIYGEPGRLHLEGRQGIFHSDHHQADRRKLSELSAGHSGGNQGAHRSAPRRISPRLAPGGNHDQRKTELGQADISRKTICAITANSPEVGEARESLAINYKGKDMAIAFNPELHDRAVERVGRTTKFSSN